MRTRVVAVVCSAAVLATGFLFSVPLTQAVAGVSAVPRPDHIVIVVEENRSEQNILGNASAPYINSLATSGANMTRFFAETHPSQPNYLALFSGSTQGVTDDSCPHTFGAANLGSELLGAGVGFAGYAETMPSAGYTGCTSGKYARKHNPWVNFSNIPTGSNQPFTSFPSDYSQLPAVSFVIPNLDNDMHDGTIAQGDAWLQNNLDGYVDWAQTHNSVFALTFDEDDNGHNNQIPTIITGQRVQSGQYAVQANHYNLLRTIEDAYGLAPVGASATANPILDIWTSPSGDQPPTAAFTSSCTDLACGFDGTGSSDTDGSVVQYTWDFGDGAAGSTATPNHRYGSAGTYQVTLTVADDEGATSSTTQPVTVTSPAGTPFASDAFNRTVTGGWGTADVGGAWTRTGAAAGVSVGSGTGRLQAAVGASQVEILRSVAQTDTDLVDTVSIDRLPGTGSMYISLTGRLCGTGNTYQAVLEIKPTGVVNLRLARTVGGAQTLLVPQVAVPGLTAAPNSQISVRLQVTGTSPTTLRARAWPSAGTEPGQWQLTTTDGTAALQAAGAIGLTNYVPANVTGGPVTLAVDSIVATRTGSTPPPNQPPTAAFSSSCDHVTCSFDTTGSADPDGMITSYSWDFGDGSAGSTAHPTHIYASTGTFTVTLLVTDDDAATGTVSHPVTTTQSTGTPVTFVAAAHGPAGSVRTEQVTVPAQAHVGDTLLLFFTYATAATWTGPSGVTGWTQLGTVTQGSIGSAVWTKTVSAGDLGAMVRMDSPAYSKGVLELAVYSGVSTGSPPVATGGGDSAQTAHATPPVSAPAGAMVVSLWSDKSETTTGWTAPAGVQQRDSAFGTGGGRYCGLLADSGGPVPAGSYGGLVATTNAASSHAAMWTVALAPAG
jgi:PKD repeat protein